MSVRLLCAADIHLGRRPSEVHPDFDPHELGPAAAWRRLVEYALQHRVDGVLLAGDLVDANNRFFEAYAPLAEGVRRLVEGHIPVYAVAGNHDHDVLARLADQIEGFHLLGRGGRWETVALGPHPSPLPKGEETPVAATGVSPVPHGDGNTGQARPKNAPATASQIRLVGWSFPDTHVVTDPLVDFPALDGDLPIVGLLHCDVDTTSSRYAPVRLAELVVQRVDAWLLGHVHQPRLINQSPPVLYPGSLQGLDPGEPGRRGAWMLTVGDGRPRFEPLPMAALRYESVEIDLSHHGDDEPFEGTIVQAIRSRIEDLRDQLGPERAIACRLAIVGSVSGRIRRRLAAATEQIVGDARVAVGEVECYVEKVEDRTTSRLALDELARSNDPLGLLARRVLTLEQGQPEEEYRRLIRAGGESISQARAAAPFAALEMAPSDAGEFGEDNREGGGGLDEQHIRRQLLAAGRALLDQLHAQREETP